MINTLMVDIETTGSKPGCKILSIGAFGFDKNGNQVEFYEKINACEQLKAGLHDDEDTMEWWNHQNAEIRNEAFSGTTDPKDACANFKIFFLKNFEDRKDFSVWSRGFDFDFPILRWFMMSYGFDLPWKFWTQCDYRTLVNVFSKFRHQIKNAESNSAKHSALEDAKAQMRGLRFITTELIARI